MVVSIRPIAFVVLKLFYNCSYKLGMAKAEENTEKQKRVIIEKSLICNYGRARYLLENALAGIKGYELSESFKSAVSNLPETYDQQVYAQFIENWGTVSALMSDCTCIILQYHVLHIKVQYFYMHGL